MKLIIIQLEFCIFNVNNLLRINVKNFVPGARFGTYQTKIGLVKIIRKYKVDICDKTLIPYKFHKFANFLMPLTGIYLMITDLEN